MPRGGKRPGAGRKKKPAQEPKPSPKAPLATGHKKITSKPPTTTAPAETLETPRRGKRGPKPGTKYKPTLEKEAAREALRAIVLAEMRDLVAAQIANAKGIKYLVVRSKRTGKFVRVAEGAAKVLQDSDEEIIEVWEKDPSVQAFTDLLDRAIDKPQPQKQELKVSGTLTLEQLVASSMTDGDA
jgi:hypothetical protein